MCKLSKIRRLTKSGAESTIVNPLLETGASDVSPSGPDASMGQIGYNIISTKTPPPMLGHPHVKWAGGDSHVLGFTV